MAKNHLLTCLCAGWKAIVPVKTNITRTVSVVVELRNASTLIDSWKLCRFLRFWQRPLMMGDTITMTTSAAMPMPMKKKGTQETSSSSLVGSWFSPTKVRKWSFMHQISAWIILYFLEFNSAIQQSPDTIMLRLRVQTQHTWNHDLNGVADLPTLPLVYITPVKAGVLWRNPPEVQDCGQTAITAASLNYFHVVCREDVCTFVGLLAPEDSDGVSAVFDRTLEGQTLSRSRFQTRAVLD